MNLGTQMYETYAPVSVPSPPGILTLLAAFQIRDDKYHFDLPRKLNEVCHFYLFDTEGVRCFAELIKMLTRCWRVGPKDCDSFVERVSRIICPKAPRTAAKSVT